jgi:hypothetical protein
MKYNVMPSGIRLSVPCTQPGKVSNTNKTLSLLCYLMSQLCMQAFVALRAHFICTWEFGMHALFQRRCPMHANSTDFLLSAPIQSPTLSRACSCITLTLSWSPSALKKQFPSPVMCFTRSPTAASSRSRSASEYPEERLLPLPPRCFF